MAETATTLHPIRRIEREEPTHTASKSSDAEREVLALLRRPTKESLSLQEIRNELLPLCTELEIQSALLRLLATGAIIFADIGGSELKFALGTKPYTEPFH